MITGSRARTLAESNWGKGGTHAYRTNRRGVFYYSCAGHGGYIVDGNALTEAERSNIDQYRKPTIVWAIRDTISGIVRKTSNPYSSRRFHARWNPDTEYLDKEYPLYYFEEDCDWAILEKFTNIRAKGFHVTEEKRLEMIDKTFNRWATPITD